MDDPEAVYTLLPDDFNKKLAKLVCVAVAAAAPAWKEAAFDTRPSLPALRSFDWRVQARSPKKKTLTLHAGAAITWRVPTDASGLCCCVYPRP